jgi:hypothetical protein
MSHADGRCIEIDERFLRDWVAYGMLELAIYLDKHSRFDEYCARRDSHPAAPSSH